MSAARVVRIGTRTSSLARWQTRFIAGLLSKRHPGLRAEIIPIVTAGDRDANTPLPRIGGKGVFTEELELALREGSIDLAVHSLKDLPVEPSPELELVVAGPRADPRDVLVARQQVTLATLPPRATVGTCSTRRTVQLRAARPDLTIVPLRGNIDTRVRKAREGLYDAILLAAAGVDRLELTALVRERLPLEVMLPAPGQGALAIQYRSGDRATRELSQPLNDAAVAAAAAAERSFLAGLGGGCDAPIAACAAVRGENLSLAGLVASPAGHVVIRLSLAGPAHDADGLGARLADLAMTHGAAELVA